MAATTTQYHCASHSDDVMTQLYQFYKDGQYTDVVVIGSVGSISCHSQVLMGNGAELCRLLDSQTIEGGAREIDCPTACVSIIQSLIEFMYTGELTITADSAKNLLQLAKQLQVKKVVTAVEEFMQTQVDPSNCISFLRYSRSHNLPHLEETAHREILESFIDICQQDEYLTLTVDELQSFLKDDELDVQVENGVFDAVVRWVKHSEETLDVPNAFLKLIEHVRLSFCTRDFLTDVVAKEELMDNYQCGILLQQALIFHMNSDRVQKREVVPTNKPRKCAISNSSIILFGGEVDGDDTPSRGCYMLKTLSNSWEQFAEVPSADHGIGSACYIKDGIFICGGFTKSKNIASCWFYNMKTSQWENKADLLTPRYAHTTVAYGDDVYVIGGFNNTYLDDVESYSFCQNIWKTLPKLKTPVMYCPALAHANKLYVFGGKDADERHTCNCQQLDMTSMTWTFIANLPDAKDGFAAVLVKHDVFLVGGKPSVCYRYGIDTDQFTVLTAPEHFHRYGTAFVHNNKIILLGGRTKDINNLTSMCEVYNVKRNQWRDWKPDLPVPMSSHVVHCIT